MLKKINFREMKLSEDWIGHGGERDQLFAIYVLVDESCLK